MAPPSRAAMPALSGGARRPVRRVQQQNQSPRDDGDHQDVFPARVACAPLPPAMQQPQHSECWSEDDSGVLESPTQPR